MDPCLGPCSPLVVWLSVPGSCLQNKDRGSKGNPVFDVDLNIGSRKELAGSSPLCVLHVGSVVDAVICMSDSMGPQTYFNCLRPPPVGMEELCSGHLLWLSDPPLSLGIGVMGTHCSKGDLWPLRLQASTQALASKIPLSAWWPLTIAPIERARSEAAFASRVSSAEASFCRQTKPSPENWSTKMVACLCLFSVKNPVICTIKLGVGGTSWSTETASPGLLVVGLWFLAMLGLHFLFVAFAQAQAEQTGMLHLASCLGRNLSLGHFLKL